MSDKDFQRLVAYEISRGMLRPDATSAQPSDPDTETLVTYAEGSLDEADAARVAVYLSKHPDQKAFVDELAQELRSLPNQPQVRSRFRFWAVAAAVAVAVVAMAVPTVYYWGRPLLAPDVTRLVEAPRLAPPQRPEHDHLAAEARQLEAHHLAAEARRLEDAGESDRARDLLAAALNKPDWPAPARSRLLLAQARAVSVASLSRTHASFFQTGAVPAFRAMTRFEDEQLRGLEREAKWEAEWEAEWAAKGEAKGEAEWAAIREASREYLFPPNTLFPKFRYGLFRSVAEQVYLDVAFRSEIAGLIDEARHLSTEDAGVQLDMAFVLMELGQYDRADHLLDTTPALPDLADRRQLAKTLLRLYRAEPAGIGEENPAWAEAARRLAQLAERPHTAAVACYNLARIAEWTGDHAAALRWWKRLLDTDAPPQWKDLARTKSA